MLYCLHPDDERLTAAEGFLLYDSIPRSRVYLSVRPWGLYELVGISTSDSAVRQCRITGIAPVAERTLYYADNRTALNIAGDTRLRGTLYLPRNGLVYGRMGTEFFDGEPAPTASIRIPSRNRQRSCEGCSPAPTVRRTAFPTLPKYPCQPILRSFSPSVRPRSPTVRYRVGS